MNKRDLTEEQVAKILEDFLDGTGGDWNWEEFTDGYPLKDDRLEAIRLKSMSLPDEFPPKTRHEYANEEGRAVLREFICELRRGGTTSGGNPTDASRMSRGKT